MKLTRKQRKAHYTHLIQGILKFEAFRFIAIGFVLGIGIFKIIFLVSVSLGWIEVIWKN